MYVKYNLFDNSYGYKADVMTTADFQILTVPDTFQIHKPLMITDLVIKCSSCGYYLTTSVPHLSTIRRGRCLISVTEI